VTEALDILADIGNLLQVLILAVIEDGIVDYNTVDGIVMIGGQDVLFELFTVNFGELELEAAVLLETQLIATRVRVR
jgi:uncharacterized protein involved in tellurium resistance